MDISLFVAFFAGMASLLSPCVLPLLPTYFAFLGGHNVGETSSSQGALMKNSCFFLCGFTLVFVAMGVSASFIGQLFFSYQDIIRKIGATFMVFMGIQLTGFLTIPLLQQERRPLLHYTFRGPIGAFIFGIAVTTGWTPCIGPILASILMYASTEEMVNQGAMLLFVYAMGFCLPFILLGFLYNKFLFRFSSIYSWLPWIQRISGIIIILVGIALYFDVMNALLVIVSKD